MKKIPTLFKREFENHKIVRVLNEITPGCEDAFLYGSATIKLDGSCCAIIKGEFYKRYDSKKGKKAPEGAIPCCEPDPVTGHHPHWVKVNPDDPADKWFVEAYKEYVKFAGECVDRTYEAVGKHFNGNPYDLKNDDLFPHGVALVHVERDFESVKQFLQNNNIEGLVFWYDGKPVCKIKRSDFGFEWPIKSKGELL